MTRLAVIDLQAFLAVAEYGSFVSAANYLHISSPALTRRIKKLEETIGALLFERNTHMVELTPAGREMLPRTRSLIAQFEDFSEDVFAITKHHAHIVAFGCVTSVAGSLLPKVMQDYSAKYPLAKMRLQDANGRAVHRLVEDREIEFGIATRPEPDSPLSFQPLIRDPIVLACWKDSFSPKRSTITWLDASELNLIYLKGESSIFHRIQEELRRENRPMPQGMTVNNVTTMMGFLEQNATAIVITDLVASRYSTEDVRVMLITEPEVYNEIGIVTFPGRTISRGAERFIEFASAMLPQLHANVVNRPALKRGIPDGC